MAVAAVVEVFSFGLYCSMLRSLLAIGLVSSSLCIPVFAESESSIAQSSSAHLVLSFSRGTLNTHGATNSSVVIPMSSMANAVRKGTRPLGGTPRNSEATSGASRDEFSLHVFRDTKSLR